MFDQYSCLCTLNNSNHHTKWDHFVLYYEKSRVKLKQAFCWGQSYNVSAKPLYTYWLVQFWFHVIFFLPFYLYGNVSVYLSICQCHVSLGVSLILQVLCTLLVTCVPLFDLGVTLWIDCSFSIAMLMYDLLGSQFNFVNIVKL